MNINIDYQSRVPIYEQIENEIIKYISLGVLKPKDKLPSIRELAVELSINFNTVTHAYKDLENKGIIVTISTKGYFVPDDVSNTVNLRVDNIILDIKNKMNELYKLGIDKEEIIKIISK